MSTPEGPSPVLLRLDEAGFVRPVDAEGRQIPIRPTAARLLDVLWEARGTVVPAEELVQRVWGEHTPGDPVASLHTTVTRLRRHLPAGALVRDSRGYRLELDVGGGGPRNGAAAVSRSIVFSPLAERGGPLVGRDELLTTAGAAVAAGRGVVLHGPSGVGRTRLVEHLVLDAASRGCEAVVLRGRAAGTEVPLGAFASLLDELTGDGALPALVSARAHLVARLDGRRLVLGVDDVHLIDPLSAVLTSQLVRAGHAVLVASRLDGAYVHPAIADLWHEAVVVSLAVPPLDREALAAMARASGRELGPAEVEDLWHLSGGNPLFASVLIEHPGSDPGRAAGLELSQLIDDHLASLSPELHDTVAVVAIAEPIRLEVLEQLTELDGLVSLERAGLVRTTVRHGSTTVEMRHRLYGEHVRRRASRLLLRSIRSQIADALAAVGTVTIAERWAMVTGWLDAGRDVDPTVGIEAARTAWRHDDLDLARRIAEPLWQRAGDVVALEVLVGAALVDRPGTEVAALAATGFALAEPSLQTRLRTTAARALALKAGDLSAALALLDGDPATAGVRAQVLAMSGAAPQALELLEGLDGPPTRLTEVVATATALTQLGRAGEALELVNAAIGRLPVDDPRASVVRRELVAATARPLMMLGRLDAALDALGPGPVDGDGPMARHAGALHGVARGGLLPWVGRPHAALAAVRPAVVELAATGHRLMERCGLMSLGFAAVQAGERDIAEEVLGRLDELPLTTMTDGVEALIRGGVLALDHRIDEAVGVLGRGAERNLERGLRFEAACAWHDVARLGGGCDPRLVELGAQDGGLAATMARHASAISAGDAALLEVAAESFAATGAHALAAEAFGRAAEAAAASGSARRAAQVLDRHRDSAARAEPGVVRVPLVLADPLTGREREVAVMAADGWSNQMIAERLGISPRTVEHHLARVFVKTGCDGRAALSTLLSRH